ncbi:MAG TPA: hypothetical protein VMU58_00795 [Gaiellaceae bacterium]|nr:hypothetical protein [Gaiellaceae bacterium]
MKKILALGAFIVLALSAVFIGTASASNGGTYTPPQCGGTMIVNVTYTLTNDADSGVAGNAWANDTVKRHLQVFDLGDGTFCAVINDTGSFVTSAGPSPANTGMVSPGISGVLNGGYSTNNFDGTLVTDPVYATHGNLGSFNLGCDPSFNCPGAHPSFLSYVSTSDWTQPAWGWTYHTAQNGDWVNSSGSNSGDITG